MRRYPESSSVPHRIVPPAVLLLCPTLMEMPRLPLFCGGNISTFYLAETIAAREDAVMLRLTILLLMLLPSTTLQAQSRNMEIYWVDVEGGAATLIVSPSGESMLIDTGFEVDGRDAK